MDRRICNRIFDGNIGNIIGHFINQLTLINDMDSGFKKDYATLRKEGTYKHYIWKWSDKRDTPDNWLCAFPIKIFGFLIGWEVTVVKEGYEQYLFTKD